MPLLEQQVHRQTEGLFQWPFFIGWPAAILGATLAIVGASTGRSGPLVAAGIVTLPIGLYLSATPGVPWGVGIPLGYFVAAALVRRGRRRSPWALVILNLGALTWLALVVLNSEPGLMSVDL